MKTKMYATTALAASIVLAHPSASYAVGNLETPTGGVVVGGSSTFSNPSPGVLNITQTTDRSVTNWQTFNIGVDAKTQISAPAATSLSVERVTGGSPAQILGTLKANDNVFVLDSNGVLFGKNAVVDVNSIVASTGDVSTSQVMSGASTIQIQNIGGGGTVENQGAITVADAGLAALVAPTVRNSGTITANVGKVTLGAGSNATVDFYGDGLLSIAVSGNLNNTLVENSGNIVAHGGQITMTAPLASSVVNSAINNTGIVDATDLTAHGGQIILTAGRIHAAGTLNASGATIPATQPSTGGNITLNSGSHGSVALVGHAIANGNFGGAIVATGSTVDVSGEAQALGTTAVGGEIDLIGSQKTIVNGIGIVDVSGLEAGGTANIGDGGSGYTRLAGTARTDGNTGGTINLRGFFVAVPGAAQAQGTDGFGGLIHVDASRDANVSGTLDASSLTAHGGTIVLEAGNKVLSSGMLNASGSTTAGATIQQTIEGTGGSIIFNSGHGTTDIAGTVNADGNYGGRIETTGGFVNVSSNNVHALGVNGIGGFIHLDSSRNTNVSGTVDATGLEGGGAVNIDSTNTVNVSGTVIASPVVVDGSARAPALPPGIITLDAPIVKFSGLLEANGFDGGGNVTLTGGRIFSSGDIQASSTLQHNGGNITFSGTTFNDITGGTLTATGGPNNGNGGTITVDKPDFVSPSVVVNVSAPGGTPGTFTH